MTVAESRSRQLAAAEVMLGGAIVIAHNVFRALPNEVPILVVLALVSLRLRRGGWDWSSLGFRRPRSWPRLVAIALAATVLRFAVGDGLIEPAAEHFWPAAKGPPGVQEITGNLKLVLLYLPVVWGFAACGEEIGYRGYLLSRAGAAGGETRGAWWAAVLLSAVLFGFGHYYKGPAGMIDSAWAGFVLGAAYLWSGRNLWTCVLAHGLMDTVALIAVYVGLNN